MTTFLVAFLLLACHPEKPADTGVPADTDTGTTVDPSAFCVDNGLAVRAFDPAATGADFDEAVGDFTIATTGGDWNLAANWSGCDSYVFVNFSESLSYTDMMLDSDAGEWLAVSPSNVHYFFLPYTSDADAIATGNTDLEAWVEAGVAALDATTADHWRSRIHYGTTTVTTTPGWIGPLITSYTSGMNKAYAFAVDRFQTVREVGYLADPLTGWETVEAFYLAYEPIRYNFEADRQARLDAQNATVYRVFDAEPVSDPGWAGVTVDADVTLPDLSGFDTWELDLTFDCTGHPELSECPAWDYLSQVYLCDAEDVTDCEEIGRYITTYWRAGRWVADASPYLALLKSGETRRFKVYNQQYNLVTLDLRFSNQGKGASPTASQFLWSGGTFNADYNAAHPAMTFTPPEGTTRVELVATISGHGYGSDPNDCGEFCNHQHAFTVNGAGTYTREFPMAGTAMGCADQVVDGVVPNQAGTWPFGRGGWCPGLEVEPWIVDITDDVTIGQENTIAYQGLVNGNERTVASTDAWIDLTSWVVFSK